MPKDLPHIIPALPPQVEAALSAAQVTRDYYAEVRSRSEFTSYCQWYRTIAAEHQRELHRMRGELNIFAWFRRR